jgi:tRNA-2-methylthio-N6-dimethylallyladenosine synthase
MRTIYVETYGCQMNSADSETMLGHLSQHGYGRAASPEDADVILLNTCAIRERAEERIIGRLGDLMRYKSRRPGVQLGIAGCMAQHVRDTLMDRLPWVDFVVGPDSYRRLPELLGAAGGDPFIDVRLDRGETYADIVPQREGGVRAWLTIMRGCDKFCTFCIVPYVRGRERSVPADSLVAQAQTLAAEGFKEIVFLGQTVNAYRDDDVDFAELLRRTAAIDGIERIRFTSPHPSDMSDRVIAAVGELDKVCPQVHLPVQSGSDRVLLRMERGYTVDEYRRIVEKLRDAVPDIALSTDIIVGFPGEEDSDFQATFDLMNEIQYDQAYMFKYSQRSGTKAAKWEETVSEDEKTGRLQTIIDQQIERAARIHRGLIGTSFPVLVESPARRGEGWMFGKSPHFRTIIFQSNSVQPGTTVDVRITEASAHTLIGESLL